MPPHQVRGQQRLRDGPTFHAAHQGRDPPGGHLGGRVVHGGQAARDVLGAQNVVEAHQRHVLGHAQARLAQGVEGGGGGQIRLGDHAGHAVPLDLGDQVGADVKGGAGAQARLLQRVPVAVLATPEMLDLTAAPRAVEHDPAVPEVQQVPGGLPRPGAVIDVHGAQARRGLLGPQGHDRQARGGQGVQQLMAAQRVAADQQAVHPAVQETFRGDVPAGVHDQRRDAQVAGRAAEARHDRPVERAAHGGGIHAVGQVLGFGSPDGFQNDAQLPGPAGPQVARGDVRHVPERAGSLADTFGGTDVDGVPGAARKHLGDGGGAHAGGSRHFTDLDPHTCQPTA